RTTIVIQHPYSIMSINTSEYNNLLTQELSMIRVKVTLNHDYPSMYHLFYGDKNGSVGTELSFFEMPMAGQTHRGTNAITRIGLLVPSTESLSFWKERFDSFGVNRGPVTEYAGRHALMFEDNDGVGL